MNPNRDALKRHLLKTLYLPLYLKNFFIQAFLFFVCSHIQHEKYDQHHTKQLFKNQGQYNLL